MMKSLKILRLLFFILLISVQAFSAQTSGFKFIVWGDSQFENPDVFEKYVKETNLLQPAFVIHVGDMITGYTYDREKIRAQWREFKKQIEPLTLPFYPTPGNHDVTTTETESLYAEAWGKDKFYYSFDHADSHFIVLDTSLHARENEIPEEERQWLKRDLEEHKSARNIFISLHVALFLDPNEDWNSIHNLLNQYPVRAVFAGNSHIYNHKLMDNIHYFIVNTSGSMNFKNHLTGYSHGILYVSVDEKDVSYAALSDGRIFPADAVPPDEYRRSPAYFQEETTLIISSPEKGDVQTMIEIPVVNRTSEKCAYILRWETDRFEFLFNPFGASVTLDPGESRKVRFALSIPRGKYFRDDLPKLRVDSPYKNSAAYETVISSYDYLFSPPEISVSPLNGDFLLDGRMEDPAWKDVPGIENLYLDKKGTEAKDKTVVKVLYDKENLYIGVKGEESNPAGLKSKAHGPIPYVFADDSFEFYLDPARTLKTFYRLVVNPRGTILSSGPKGLFTFSFDVKTYVGKDFWSAEFKIPYARIKAAPPQKGAEWGMNVRRNRTQAASPVSEWSRMRGFPAQPQYFGILKFE